MKKFLISILLLLNQHLFAQQPFTLGEYSQIYWDWRPDIADSCYEFTFERLKSADSMGDNYCAQLDLFYWNDCNYGTNYIGAAWWTMISANTPLHDTLYRVSPPNGYLDTWCGFPTVLHRLNWAQIMEPLRNKVIYKGLVYLPEKCKNWHFALGAYYVLCGSNSSAYTRIFFNQTLSYSGWYTYSNRLSNIDSLFFDPYSNMNTENADFSLGFYGCSFNNVDFPNNSSPRFLSAPIYSYQIHKPVEYNPGPYDPDHDSMYICIEDTIRDSGMLLTGGSGPMGFDTRTFVNHNALGDTLTEIITKKLLYAALPGQTGPNPLRYTPQNPFDTDSTFLLDHRTGKTTFTAKSIMEPALYYSVKDYRNGVFVSESYCVNQFTILSDGRLPSFIRIDTTTVSGAHFDGNGQIISCPNSPISFEAYVKLPGGPSGNLIVTTTADTTLLGNGTCTMTGQHSDSVRLHFTWKPPANATGLYNVFISAKDSNCNPPYHHYTQVYTWNFIIDTCLAPASASQTLNENYLFIYPNPANDILHISGSKPFQSLKLFSQDGREILSRQFNAVSEMDLETGDIAAGMYLLVVDGRYMRKVFILR